MRKKILLVGGSYGIGASLVSLLEADCDLYIVSRTAGDLESSSITHIAHDIATDTFPEHKLPEKLDGFVYLPGSINLKPFKMLKSANFREDMEINFFRLVETTERIMPRLNDGASIVFFSTVAVGRGMAYHASIAAAKGAVEGFARAIAAEYAPRVRCNVIAPSLVDTPLASRLLGNEKKRELMAERHPLKRVGSAEDIARAAAYLLSDNSSWVSGQVMGVDGGMSTLNMN